MKSLWIPEAASILQAFLACFSGDLLPQVHATWLGRGTKIAQVVQEPKHCLDLSCISLYIYIYIYYYVVICYCHYIVIIISIVMISIIISIVIIIVIIVVIILYHIIYIYILHIYIYIHMGMGRTESHPSLAHDCGRIHKSLPLEVGSCGHGFWMPLWLHGKLKQQSCR